MDVDPHERRPSIYASCTTSKAVILLDTSALIWLAQGHSRVASIVQRGQRLYVSPASLLEMQLLVEAGRLRLRVPNLHALASDAQCAIDDPSSADWFEQAWTLSWTRDPFDRLIVAHARLRRWRLATADVHVLEHLSATECVAL